MLHYRWEVPDTRTNPPTLLCDWCVSWPQFLRPIWSQLPAFRSLFNSTARRLQAWLCRAGKSQIITVAINILLIFFWQLNQNTAYLDGSAIYGSTDDVAASLRQFSQGKLRVTVLGDYHLLPKDLSRRDCIVDHHGGDCFVAGRIQ